MIRVQSETKLKIVHKNIIAAASPTEIADVPRKSSLTTPLSDDERREGSAGFYSQPSIGSIDLMRLHSYDHSMRTSIRETASGLLLDETDPFRVQIKAMWRDNFSTMVGIVISLTVLGLWWVVDLLLKFDNPKERLPEGSVPPPTGFLHLFLRTQDDFDLLFICAVTVISTLTGLYAEIFLGTRITALLDDEESKWRWLYAQFAFAFLVIIGCGCGTLLGLPFVVIGMYKFGYPETISFLHRGYTHFQNGNLAAIPDYFDGVGLILHHSATIFCITCLQMHYVAMNGAIVSCMLPPLIQHVAVKVKYFHKKVYIVLCLILEIWFQVEVFSCLGYIEKKALRIAGSIMIFAHWLFFLAGVLGLLCERELKKPSFIDCNKCDVMNYLSESEFVE